jgi:hypothetical protein
MAILSAHQRAERLVRRAAKAKSAAERLAFLKLASSWLEIAHDAELHRGTGEKDPFRPTFT